MPERLAATLRRVLVGALAVAAVGCAGADEVKLPGPDATTARLTKIQYTVQANEICRATTTAIVKQTEAVGSGGFQAGAGGDRQKLEEAVAPIARLALTRLRNLTPPPEDADLARRAIDTMQSAVDAFGREPEAPLDPVGLNQPEFFDYGLTGCFSKR